MHEYEIRNLYNRIGKTKLEIADIIIQIGGNSTKSKGRIGIGDWSEFILFYQVMNISNSIEKYYKLEISLPKNIYHGNYDELSSHHIRKENDYNVFSVQNKDILFQNEKTTMIKSISKIFGNYLFENNDIKIKLKLYYSNGVDEKTISVKNKLKEEWLRE